MSLVTFALELLNSHEQEQNKGTKTEHNIT